MNLRLKNLYLKLEKAHLDGLIITSASNISYLVEFISRDSYLIISRKKNTYLTDSRYIEETKKNLAKYFALEKIDAYGVFKVMAKTCLKQNLKKLGFEENHLTFSNYKEIEKAAGGKIELVPTRNLIEELRQIKGPEEIEKINKAVYIAREALRYAQDFIGPGKKEIEVAAELERFVRYCGARSCAFDFIVASGPNSSFPHHLTSSRKIKENEPVLVDIGVDYSGYKSDLTRVFFSGKINFLIRRIYKIVLEAQRQAISKMRPGAKICQIDAVARNYIGRKGFARFFVHSLGHAIGLDVHEEPRLNLKENCLLKPGMVFTVEPAIYLPEKFGVRLEDMVLVTKKGTEVLSGSLNK